MGSEPAPAPRLPVWSTARKLMLESSLGDAGSNPELAEVETIDAIPAAFFKHLIAARESFSYSSRAVTPRVTSEMTRTVSRTRRAAHHRATKRASSSLSGRFA